MKLMNLKEVTPYAYNELPVKGFEKIITKLLKDAPFSDTPTFVHMLGIPGSGKSTFCKNNKEKFKNYFLIEFDALMEAHPGYQRDVKELGPAEAFSRWEIPSRVAGYELLSRAIEARTNILLDHTGAPKCHQELLKNVKKLGYRTEMYYIYCPVELAIKRIKARELETKRHTPVKLITERFAFIEENIDTYKTIVDKFVRVN